MVRPSLPCLTACLALSACGAADDTGAEPERISLAETGQRQGIALESPDTSGGGWQVAENGQAILFADPGEDPWLTLACDLSGEPAEFVIIRHAQALPGQTALFPFVGNGMRSRFLADATLAREGERGEWRWEARLPADDPQLDVFAGTRDLTATLPGRGMLEIAGSRIPGDFLEWCRAGGEVPEVGAEEDAPEAEDEVAEEAAPAA